MKNVTILILFCFLSNFAFTQNNCDHNVSTKVGSANNDALPSADPNKYLNNFDWFPRTSSGLYDDYQMTNINFSGVNIPEMSNIMLNAMSHYDYVTQGPLPLSENGWELLLVNAGRYPDDVTPITSSNYLSALPYIVIYNRYSGTLRVFVNFGLDGNGNDAIELRVLFFTNTKTNPNVSGLLRYNNGQDITLDNTTDVVDMTSVVKAPQFANQWASTDIKIAYDPCTCYYPTKLKIELSIINTSDIRLVGRSVEFDDEPLVGTGNIANPVDFLAGFNSLEGEEGGLVLHKSMQKMVNDYHDKYAKYNTDLVAAGKHNAKVKTNLAILKLARYVTAAIVTVASGGVGTAIAGATTLAAASPAMYQQALSDATIEGGTLNPNYQNLMFNGLPGVPVTNWMDAVEAFGNGIIKKEGEISKTIDNEKLFKAVKIIFGEKGKLFIAENFETKSIPTAPTIPTANFTEMKFLGSISDKDYVGGPIFYNPGTYGSVGTGSPTITNVNEYPVYNEILGTFALLNEPKILISNSIKDATNELYGIALTQMTSAEDQIVYADMLRIQNWTKSYQFKLNEDLKYAFNSALDIKSTSINAYFEIEATPISSIPVVTFSNPQNALVRINDSINSFHAYNDKHYSFNTTSNNTNIEAFTPISHQGNGYGTITQSSVANYSSLGNPYAADLGVKMLQTPSMPIDYFKNTISRIGIKNETFIGGLAVISTDPTGANIVDGIYNQTPPFLTYPNQSPPAYSVLYFDQQEYLGVQPFTVNSSIHGYSYSFKVKLKLVVDIEFNTINSSGFNNATTLIHTYDIDPTNISYQNVDISSTLGNSNSVEIQEIQETVNVPTTNFDGLPKPNFKILGNKYYCDSRTQTRIVGDLTTSNGYKAEIRGGSIVVADPETTLSPEIELLINPVMNQFYSAMPTISTTNLANYCSNSNNSSTSYSANNPTPSKKMLNYLAAQQVENENNERRTLNPFSFNLFPNPATQETTIRLVNAYNNEATVKVFDITGKELVVAITKTENDLRVLNLATLQAGIYLVKVETYGETQTKQLVVK